MRLYLIILALIFTTSLQAQVYDGNSAELFFYRTPSARAAAMGNILVLNYDQNFVSHSNPANLAESKGLSLFYSKSSPYTFAVATSRNYKLFFGGTSYNFGKAGAFGFNISIFDFGVINYYESLEGPMHTFHQREYIYTFTYANKLKNWFNFGINFNYYKYSLLEDSAIEGYFWELGLSKLLEIAKNSCYQYNIEVAGQIKNLFNQASEFVGYKSYFPSIMRLGISHNLMYSNESLSNIHDLLGVKCGFEYQNVLNSDIYTAYKIGCEISLLDIIFLRAGYYTESHQKFSNYFYNSDGSLNDFTYGMGLKLELAKHFKTELPLTISFDFVNMQQPTYLTNITLDNFTTYNLSLNYEI